jgi:hypothetical protein
MLLPVSNLSHRQNKTGVNRNREICMTSLKICMTNLPWELENAGFELPDGAKLRCLIQPRLKSRQGASRTGCTKSRLALSHDGRIPGASPVPVTARSLPVRARASLLSDNRESEGKALKKLHKFPEKLPKKRQNTAEK